MDTMVDLARTLVEARTHDRVLDAYPGAYPATLEEAYAIQNQAIQLDGRDIGGWKIGRIRSEDVDRFGADRLAGPIFRDRIIAALPDRPVSVPVLRGFAAAEAEVLLRLSAIPAFDATLEEVIACVEEVRFGLEIASSPFTGINEHGPAVTASDFGNNYGLVVGPAIVGWRDPDWMASPVELSVDGQSIGTGHANEGGGPFAAAAFLIRLMASRNCGFAAGQWISTGAITGVHPVQPGQMVRATFGRELEVTCMTTSHARGSTGRGAA